MLLTAHWRIDKREFSKAAIDADLPESMNARARVLCVDPATLSRVLNGRNQPGAALLAQLRLMFGPEVFDRIARAEEAS